MCAYPVDLHVHSVFSDGDLTPTALLEEAANRKLQAIALTDHDTVSGVEEAITAGNQKGIRVIPGIELTAEYQVELHILGLFIDPQNPRLQRVTANLRQARIDRVHNILKKLADLEIQLDIDAILSSSQGNIGRPHIARALLKAGYVQHFDEAFQRYLAIGAPAYLPASKLSSMEAIDLIHEAGGLAILAHPGIDNADAQLSTLVAQGLDGLETCHPAHTARINRHLRRSAAHLGLVQSGGSDFHTPLRPCHLGDYGLLLPALQTLEARCTARRNRKEVKA